MNGEEEKEILEETPLFMEVEEEVVEVESEDEEKKISADTLVKIKDRLKGKVREEKEENLKLKARIDELEKKVNPAEKEEVKLPTRPKLSDFESDEDFDKAMDDYETKKLAIAAENIRKEEVDGLKLQKVRERIKGAVDAHYDRATSLIEKHGINPDVYVTATESFKEAVQEVIPTDGVFEALIDVMGEGSEKTIFAIGRNKTKLSVLKDKLRDGTQGLTAAFFLGAETARLNPAKSKTSQAPKPGSQLKGDGAPVEAKSLKKQFDAATKAGNAQERYNIKKLARRSGVDTSKWS